MHILFDSISLKNFIVKCVWFLSNYEMGDLLRSFLKSVSGTKHDERCCVDLWRRSLIMKVVETNR